MVKIGQKLHDARIRKGLTLEEVSSKTKIKVNFLSAIEKGEYKKLPSSAYAVGFVKNYSAFLGLPEVETVALFRREFDEKNVFDVLPQGLSEATTYSASGFRMQREIVIGVFLFLGLLLYIGFQYKDAFVNPSLTLYSPKEKQVFSSSNIEVYGKADQNAVVYVNDIPVSVNQNGEFKKTVSLFEGKKLLQIRAINRFGREAIETVNVEIKSH